jgi:TRAP-type uncharacterized transport system substrate-binding protein
MKKWTLALTFISLLIGGCSDRKLTFRLIYSPDEPMGFISKELEKVIEDRHNYDIELIIGEGSIANLDSLKKGTADLTIVENYVPYQDSIMSITTLFPQILHIFYFNQEQQEDPTSLEDLLYGKRVFIGEEGSGSYRFMMNLFSYFNLDQDQFTITDNAFDNDITAGFSDILPPSSLIGLDDFSIFSLDQVDRFGKGSVVEGISLRYPKVQPFIIPEGTYQGLTKKPIVTVSTDAILVAREGMRENIIYDITRAIYEEKQEFINISPLIFKGMEENFERSKLSFPLHEGARVFLDRDEPGFLERYAELFGVIFSVMVALVSGLVSLGKWQSQRKKDRVDIFYKELMQVKNAIPGIRSIPDAREQIKTVQQSQNKAFDMLISEELEANESFRIYMELSKETIQELRGRIRAIRTLKKS